MMQSEVELRLAYSTSTFERNMVRLCDADGEPYGSEARWRGKHIRTAPSRATSSIHAMPIGAHVVPKHAGAGISSSIQLLRHWSGNFEHRVASEARWTGNFEHQAASEARWSCNFEHQVASEARLSNNFEPQTASEARSSSNFGHQVSPKHARAAPASAKRLPCGK